jgi:glycosyltransferase involved in cell wall biosynthesis
MASSRFSRKSSSEAIVPAEPAPLRIAMACYYMPSNSKAGVGYQAHALATALTRRGHEVTVFTSSPSVDGAAYQTTTVPLQGAMRSLRFAMWLRRADWSAYDVLHAHAGDYLLFPGRVAAHIRTVHGSSLREARHISGLRSKAAMTFYWLCEMLATVVADESVAVSANTKRRRPWIRTTIPNGVDLSRFHPGTQSPRPSILFVGTYEQRKRGRFLADTFESEVLPSVPDAELWMVADDAPKRRGVSVLGRVSEEALADLYRSAWVFCLPSSYEGFGIPYIEAMASGCPVVATPNLGAAEVLGSGRYGVLVEDDSLGSTLVRLLESPAERRSLAAAGLEHAAGFDIERIASQYEALYRRVGARRRADLGTAQPPV